MRKTRISICINTYKRPKLLSKLLYSLNDQILNDDIELEIIVVDNSPEKEGIEQVVNFEPHAKHSIKYAEQPIKNISITRNKAVSMATGEFICFVDDDEYADNHWIQNLYNCLNTYQADIVMGMVQPYYDESIPQWIIDGKYFQYFVQNSGEESVYTRTSNCIVKHEIINDIDGPFDESLGLIGGEDVKLFEYLRSKGAKIVFCKEAIVHDFIPKDRATFKWLSARYFRSGITSTNNQIALARKSKLKKVEFLTKYLIFLPVSTLLMFAFIFSKKKRFFWYLKTVGILGHFAAIFNLKYHEYS